MVELGVRLWPKVAAEVLNLSVRYRGIWRSDQQKKIEEGDPTALCDEADWWRIRRLHRGIRLIGSSYTEKFIGSSHVVVLKGTE